MSHLLETFLRFLAHHPNVAQLISATLTSAGVAVIAWSLALQMQRRSARARVLVWRLALVMLLAVAGWRLMPDAPSAPVVVEWRVAMPAQASAPVPLTDYPALVQPSKTWWQNSLTWLERSMVHLWLGVAACLFAWRVTKAVTGLLWLRRNSVPASAFIEARLCSLDVPAHMRCRLARHLRSPLLTGWRKPVIWLPRTAADWDVKRIDAVLRHEVAHWRRMDLPWHWLAHVTTCLWWWQPLAWHVVRALRVETEHATDDEAVLSGGDAHDYARALVEIAAGIPAGRHSAAGVEMFGSGPVQRRVRELMQANHWRGRVGIGTLSTIAVFAVILAILAATRLEFTPQAPSYRSVAKLVAGAQATGNRSWQEQLIDFYGTIIETIESAEMKRRAMERVRALNPNLKDEEVEISVSQVPKSAIFVVEARGGSKRYPKVFLDSLLDEFIAFRQAVREQAGGKSLHAFLQQTVERQKLMEEKVQKLEAFQRENNAVVLMNANNDVANRLGSLAKQQELLRTEAEELQLVLGNISNAGALRETGGRSGGEYRPSEVETQYLKTKTELFMLDNERRFLLQKRNPDHAEVVSLNEKVEKATFLLQSLVTSVESEMRQRLEDVQRRMAMLAEQRASLAEEALVIGRKVAEHEKLRSQAQLAQEAYQKFFDQSERIVSSINLRTEYVAIQERASPATEVVQTGLLPVWRLWSASRPPEHQGSATQQP